MQRQGTDRKRAELFRDELDFAFFAARLGWSRAEYEETTPVQRMFVRKEIETVTVERSDLLKNAVQIAVANVYSKRKRKLWAKRRKKAEPVIPKKEIDAIKKQFERKAPWTPWARKEVPNG